MSFNLVHIVVELQWTKEGKYTRFIQGLHLPSPCLATRSTSRIAWSSRQHIMYLQSTPTTANYWNCRLLNSDNNHTGDWIWLQHYIALGFAILFPCELGSQLQRLGWSRRRGSLLCESAPTKSGLSSEFNMGVVIQVNGLWIGLVFLIHDKFNFNLNVIYLINRSKVVMRLDTILDGLIIYASYFLSIKLFFNTYCNMPFLPNNPIYAIESWLSAFLYYPRGWMCF